MIISRFRSFYHIRCDVIKAYLRKIGTLTFVYIIYVGRKVQHSKYNIVSILCRTMLSMSDIGTVLLLPMFILLYKYTCITLALPDANVYCIMSLVIFYNYNTVFPTKSQYVNSCFYRVFFFFFILVRCIYISSHFAYLNVLLLLPLLVKN